MASGRMWVRAVAVSLAVVGAMYGCSVGSSRFGTTSSSSGSGGGDGGDIGVGVGGGIGGGFIGNGINIEPLDQVIQVEYGAVGPTVQYTAKDNDGNPINVAWEVNTSLPGSISAGGLYSTNGNAGGPVEITARYNDEEATTTLTIELHAEENPGNVSQGNKDILDMPGGGSAATWTMVYPYDGTVFPRGILPPEIQINNTGAPAAYKLSVTMPGCAYEGYFTPMAQFAMTQGTWDAIGSCSTGDDAAVEIAKVEGGVKYVINRSWRIARGKLKGVIYYNTYDSPLAGNGATMRINGNSPQPVVWSGNCTVCHSVSADGSTGAAANHSGQGGIFDLTNNSPNPPLVWTDPEKAAFAGIYPDGSVFVVQGAPGYSYPPNTPGTPGPWYSELRTRQGQPIPASGIESYVAQTPNFSPDGTMLAFTNRQYNCSSNCVSQLNLFNFDFATKKFTSLQTLATPQAGRHYSWPTFMPDGHFVIYQDGIGDDLATWGSNTAKVNMVGTQSHTVTPLAKLNGDGYMPGGVRDENLNYEPTMLPVSSGGYYWLMYTSRRTYGNRLTGDRSVTKRLWVSAIDVNAQDGVDPSHPGFYVAGQELNSGNSRGFWVLEPCRDEGETCEEGSDCCEGNCNNGICGHNEGGCVQQGNSCMTDADCCNAPQLKCIGTEGNKFCDVIPPE